MTPRAPHAGRRLRIRPPTTFAALGAVAVVGAALLVSGGDQGAARVTYAAVGQGRVTATVGAAGTIESA